VRQELGYDFINLWKTEEERIDMEKKTAREKEEIIAERKDKAEQTKFKLCRQGPMNQADPLSKDIF
jgi:hypothetical protein